MLVMILKSVLIAVLIYKNKKSYKKIKIETDDNIDPKDKVVSIDSPILTFVFGIFALMCGFTLLSNRLPIPLIVVFLFFYMFLSFVLFFY